MKTLLAKVEYSNITERGWEHRYTNGLPASTVYDLDTLERYYSWQVSIVDATKLAVSHLSKASLSNKSLTVNIDVLHGDFDDEKNKDQFGLSLSLGRIKIWEKVVQKETNILGEASAFKCTNNTKLFNAIHTALRQLFVSVERSADVGKPE